MDRRLCEKSMIDIYKGRKKNKLKVHRLDGERIDREKTFNDVVGTKNSMTVLNIS